MKVYRFFMMLALSVLVLCSPLARTGEVVIDSFGNRLEARPYKRIVSLAPNLTEIVGYVGRLGDLVGVTDYCDFPPEVKNVAKVGGFIDPNVEAIVALKPEIVLAYRGNPLPVINKLKEVGIPVFVLDNAKSLDELLGQISELAKLLCAQEFSLKKLKKLEAILNAHRDNLAQTSAKPTALLFTNENPPFFCAGTRTLHDSLVAYAGCKNAFVYEGYAQISPEAILKSNPDMIVVPLAEGKDAKDLVRSLIALPYIRQTKAAKLRQIIAIDEDRLLRPGPRIFDVLVELSAKVSEVRK